MPIVYQSASSDTLSLLDKAIDTYHPDIREYDLKIGVLFATSVDKKGNSDGKPSVKLANHPAAAKIKLVSLKDRIFKKLDAEITIDGCGWSQFSEATKLAVLDHELEHIVIDKSPEAEAEDDGRPKLKLKDDDFMVWGFQCILERHGIHSPEAAGIKSLLSDTSHPIIADYARTVLAHGIVAPVRRTLPAG